MEEVAAVVPGVASNAAEARPRVVGDRVAVVDRVAGDRTSAVVRASGAVVDSSSRVALTTAAMETVAATTRVETGAAREETHGTRVPSRVAGEAKAAAGAREVAILATISETTTSKDIVPVRCAPVATRTSDRRHTVWSRMMVTKVASVEAVAATMLEATDGTRRFPGFNLTERGWDARAIV